MQKNDISIKQNGQVFKFDTENSFEKRKADYEKIKSKYPDRVPIIVERSNTSKMEQIDKPKFLVPTDMTVGQFVYVIRKRIRLAPEKALFVFVKNTLPPTSQMIGALHAKNHDEDGFLKITYADENTFGSV